MTNGPSRHPIAFRFNTREEVVRFFRGLALVFDSMHQSLSGYIGSHEGRDALAARAPNFQMLRGLQELARVSMEKSAIGEPIVEVVADFSFNLRTFLSDPAISQITDVYPFNEHDLGGIEPKSLVGIFPRDGTVYQALEALVEFLRIVDFPRASGSLREIAPDQKPSPLQFAIENGRLAVLKQPAIAEEQDNENVRAAREALMEAGEALIEGLERSNSDPRLLDSLRKVQQRLESQSDVIQLGLANLACRAMCAMFESELSDAHRALMIGHTQGVAMYVGQFPDWQRFSDNASEAELDVDDVQRIADTAKAIVSDLENNPEIAEAEVPRTIVWLQQLVNDPKTTSKRAAFALMRTIENLVAQTIRHSVDLIDQTVDKTKGKLSGAASVLITGFLIVALSGALGLSPLTGKLGEVAWMKTAADLVKSQLQDLAK